MGHLWKSVESTRQHGEFKRFAKSCNFSLCPLGCTYAHVSEVPPFFFVVDLDESLLFAPLGQYQTNCIG